MYLQQIRKRFEKTFMISSFLSMTLQKNPSPCNSNHTVEMVKWPKGTNSSVFKNLGGDLSQTVFLKRDKKCRKRFFQEKPSSSIKSWVPDQLELVEENVTFTPALKKMKLFISVVCYLSARQTQINTIRSIFQTFMGIL